MSTWSVIPKSIGTFFKLNGWESDIENESKMNRKKTMDRGKEENPFGSINRFMNSDDESRAQCKTCLANICWNDGHWSLINACAVSWNQTARFRVKSDLSIYFASLWIDGTKIRFDAKYILIWCHQQSINQFVCIRMTSRTEPSKTNPVQHIAELTRQPSYYKL